MNQVLITTEQLSYRQLCIIAILGPQQWGEGKLLSNKILYDEKHKISDEHFRGVYEDVMILINMGLVLHAANFIGGYTGAATNITPRKLHLQYFGEVLFNAMGGDSDMKQEMIGEVLSVLI